MNPKHRIIGIAGKKQSGKDTVCNILKTMIGWEKCFRVAFADELKDEIAKAIRMDREYINKHKENFRLILQGWGTDFRRKLCGEDYWIKKWHDKVCYMLSEMPNCTIITPDVRFQNEADIIHQMGGIVIGINTDGFPPLIDTHDSEQLLFPVDFEISNTFEQPENLLPQLRKIIQ
jgi:hypothetical protein